MPSWLYISSSAVATLFLSHQESASSGSTFTFSGLSFGTAVSNRYIVACITWSGSPSHTLSSCTIGGIAASIITQINGGGSTIKSSAICIAAVPSGTSGSVVVTFGGSIQFPTVALYSVTGIPLGTASSSATSAAGAPTATLNVPAQGAVIAVADDQGTGSTPTASWTNLSKDLDAVASGFNTVSTASAMFSSANSSLPVTCTFSNGTGASGCFAVFSS